MKRREVTVHTLAMRIGKPEKTIYRWRAHPRGPSISDCAEIARVLGVPLTDLVPTPRAAASAKRRGHP
jgi:hypothetical protein